MKLIADAMLGSLARWLRVLGLDTAYDPSLDDGDLVVRANAEGRLILTRDRRLVERRSAKPHLLIRSDQTSEQIRQVLRELPIRIEPGSLFARCLRCNRTLVEVKAERVQGKVPAFVAGTQRRFRECPSCGRIYWRATHMQRMKERLRELGIEPG